MRASIALLSCLLVLPAFAADEVKLLPPEVEEGKPAKVRVQGSASLPDKLILSVSIKVQRSDIHGQQWRLLESYRVPVQGGAFERTFSFENGLTFGTYRVEVDCDKGHQYPGIQLPAGNVHAESSFKVDFTDDIGAPLKGHVDALCTLSDLWSELEAKFSSLSSRAKDPAAIEEWKRFAEPWAARASKACGDAPSQEELLYPEVRQALSGLSNKIQLFRQDHESVLSTGEPCETRKAHANWFDPDPSTDLVNARARVAQEFAFNAGKKVVDYGYDRATEILGRVKGASNARAWEVFREKLSRDLDRVEKAYRELADGACKAEMADIASDVPALLAAGRDLLTAGDQTVSDPSKGAQAMSAAKEALKRAYKSVQDRIAAAEAKRMARPAK